MTPQHVMVPSLRITELYRKNKRGTYLQWPIDVKKKKKSSEKIGDNSAGRKNYADKLPSGDNPVHFWHFVSSCGPVCFGVSEFNSTPSWLSQLHLCMYQYEKYVSGPSSLLLPSLLGCCYLKMSSSKCCYCINRYYFLLGRCCCGYY